MTKTEPVKEQSKFVQIVRHAEVHKRINVSSATLFDMVAKGQFPKPFPLILGGRAKDWIEADVDCWILERKAASEQGAV